MRSRDGWHDSMHSCATSCCDARHRYSWTQVTTAMSSAALSLIALVTCPAVVVLASFLRVGVERLRTFTLIAAAAMLLTSLAVAISPDMRAFAIRTSMLSGTPGG